MTALTDADAVEGSVLGRVPRLFDRWLLAPAPIERLVALRVLTGGFVLVYLIANVGEFARLARQPSVPFEPVGVAQILDGPLGASIVWILFAALIVAGAAFTAGALYRLSGPGFALLVLFWVSYHSSWGQMLHFEHLFTLHLLILALAPAGSSAEHQVDPSPSTRFGWPIRLMAITTVLTYSIAGIAKLRESGLDWLDGSTLRNHVAYSATRIDLLGGIEPPLAGWVIDRGWMLAPMAVVALGIELFAPVALRGSRVRNVWVVAALGFHAATAATMMVWFPYQGLAFAMLPLFEVERWRSILPGALRSGYG